MRAGAALGLSAGMRAVMRAAIVAATVAAARTAPAQAPTLPAGRVITDTVWSQALGARKSLMVYLPPSYATSGTRRYPVAYYLHGAEGNETDWLRVGHIDAAMDSLVAAGGPEMIIVMPDGDNSWWTTYNVLVDAAQCRTLLSRSANAERDCVAWPHYDDYVAYDVVRHVDARYRTVAAREARGIAGLSMGGYGAFQLALQYPGVFSAAASHSGVLWPTEYAPPPFGRGLLPRPVGPDTLMRSFANRWAARFRLIFGADSASWNSRDPAHTLARLRAAGRPLPPLYADCGTSDTFLAQSRAFADAMRAQGVPLEYHEYPGDHAWTYWRAHVGQSLAWLGARIAAGSPSRR